MRNALVTKNVTIGDKRTSLRLEEDLWEALESICEREHVTIHQLCTLVERYRHSSSRTSAVRAFTVSYWRMSQDSGSVNSKITVPAHEAPPIALTAPAWSALGVKPA